MKIAIAEISQETDTFSPVLTGLLEFERNGLYCGDEILVKMPGIGPLGGFLSSARDHPTLEIVPLVRAQATPGGRIAEDTFKYLMSTLLAELVKGLPLDGVFLSLHGAASTEETDDVEGYILKVVRHVVGPRVPIIAALDHHANITRLMMTSADIVVGFQTQPHDQVETGERAARILFELVRKKVSPACGWFKIPMITPQDQFLTSTGPMKTWFDLARGFEEVPTVITASTFPMQPWVDVEEAGWASAVYTDGDPELATRLAATLANQAWELRHRFWVSERVTLSEAIRKAERAAEGLVILADTGDSVYGGAPGDSTCLLREMLSQRIASTAFVPMVDAAAVTDAFQAGEGQQVTLSLGGKMDNIFSKPVQVTGSVARIARNLVTELGQAGRCELGRTALLEVGSIKVVLADSRIQAINFPEMYTHLGLEIDDAKMVVLKTASNFQHFSPWRKGLIRVDTPGMTQSNLQAFDWIRAPRPLYPFDELDDWQAAV
jgi:microcystin degradation protein MlrC